MRGIFLFASILPAIALSVHLTAPVSVEIIPDNELLKRFETQKQAVVEKKELADKALREAVLNLRNAGAALRPLAPQSAHADVRTYALSSARQGWNVAMAKDEAEREASNGSEGAAWAALGNEIAGKIDASKAFEAEDGPANLVNWKNAVAADAVAQLKMVRARREVGRLNARYKELSERVAHEYEDIERQWRDAEKRADERHKKAQQAKEAKKEEQEEKAKKEEEKAAAAKKEEEKPKKEEEKPAAKKEKEEEKPKAAH
jgi:hypothetical protein